MASPSGEHGEKATLHRIMFIFDILTDRNAALNCISNSQGPFQLPLSTTSQTFTESERCVSPLVDKEIQSYRRTKVFISTLRDLGIPNLIHRSSHRCLLVSMRVTETGLAYLSCSHHLESYRIRVCILTLYTHS